MFFVQVFVVDLVGLAKGFEVNAVAVPQPAEPLVDENIVHQKICGPVHGNSCAYTYHEIMLVHQPQHNTQPAGNGKDQKEKIVLFEKTLPGLVMVPVKIPHEPVHHKFMGAPGNAFHGDEGQ